jgi:bacteriophage HK97-gp10 putative tail-component
VIFNEQRLRFLLDSPAGPVGRFLARSGVRVESAAKAIATSEGLVRTGRYRASIAWRLSHDGRSLLLEVGSAVPHARLLERGSPPHSIGPTSKRALWWTHGADRGWLVPDRPLAGVNHPGTRAYRVMHRAVQQVLGGQIRTRF